MIDPSKAAGDFFLNALVIVILTAPRESAHYQVLLSITSLGMDTVDSRYLFMQQPLGLKVVSAMRLYIRSVFCCSCKVWREIRFDINCIRSRLGGRGFSGSLKFVPQFTSMFSRFRSGFSRLPSYWLYFSSRLPTAGVESISCHEISGERSGFGRF